MKALPFRSMVVGEGAGGALSALPADSASRSGVRWMWWAEQWGDGSVASDRYPSISRLTRRFCREPAIITTVRIALAMRP